MSESIHLAPPIARCTGNPILAPSDWPYEASAVFNPGAVRLSDGQTVLLCRAELRDGFSHLAVARSDDGVSGWKIDPSPALSGNLPDFPEEQWGVEDPRIVYLPEREEFAVIYTCYGPHGPGVSIAMTHDFRTFRRIGNVLPPEDKDAALIPCRIDGKWLMIHRPVCNLPGKHIWISQSPDLLHWGNRKLLLKARSGGWWDAHKIGLATPPIPTSEGYLIIYHGVRETVSGSIYRIGLALLDTADPTHCLLRGRPWIMGPETPDERVGDVGNVVFPCGFTVDDDGDGLKLYYGMADTSIGLATSRISELLGWLRQCGDHPQEGT